MQIPQFLSFVTSYFPLRGTKDHELVAGADLNLPDAFFALDEAAPMEFAIATLSPLFSSRCITSVTAEQFAALNATTCLQDKYDIHKTGVINDPIGQTHNHASSEHCFLLFCFSRFEKWGRTDGRTTCAKTMIPTGRDFGLAKWINNIKYDKNDLKTGSHQ